MAILAIGFSDREYNHIKETARSISFDTLGMKPDPSLELGTTIERVAGCKNVDVFLMDDKILPHDPRQAVAYINEISNIFNTKGLVVIPRHPKLSVKYIIDSGLVEFIKRPLDALDLTARIHSVMELKKTKQRQADAEKWFYQVVENLPVIFAEYEDGINVKYSNALGADIWGIPHEEVLNPPDRWIHYIHPEDKDRVIHAIGNMGHKPLNLQYRIVRPDGQLRWIDDSFIPIFDENGSRQKIFGFGSDITKRKLAEFSLQKSEEHLHILLESVTNFAIYRVAFESGDFSRSKVIFVSPSIVDILGVTDLSFNAWLDSFHPDDAKKIEKNLISHAVDLKDETVVRVFHSVFKEWRWIQIVANRTLDENNHLKYSSGIMFDVTDRIQTSMALKEKEKELRTQAGKLEKLNSAMSALLDYREKEIETVKKNTLETLNRLVRPYIQDMCLTDMNKDQQTLLDIISAHLNNISASFARTLSTWKGKLSPMEIKVADLVRSGKTTKEISQLLKVTTNAVSFHRANIRTKLGISNEKVNLTSYLRTLEMD